MGTSIIHPNVLKWLDLNYDGWIKKESIKVFVVLVILIQSWRERIPADTCGRVIIGFEVDEECGNEFYRNTWLQKLKDAIFNNYDYSFDINLLQFLWVYFLPLAIFI